MLAPSSTFRKALGSLVSSAIKRTRGANLGTSGCRFKAPGRHLKGRRGAISEGCRTKPIRIERVHNISRPPAGTKRLGGLLPSWRVSLLGEEGGGEGEGGGFVEAGISEALSLSLK